MGIHDLLFVVLTAVTWTAATPTRNWTDASGRFSVEAEMVGFQDGLVHLKRADGKVVKVPLEKLSPADQAFARQTAASSPKTEPPAAVAADAGVIRLPFADGMFQRTVWIDAMDAAGTGQATASLGDGSRPKGALPPWAAPPLTEGYFLGLSGLPTSPDPIAKVVMRAAPLDGLRVGRVEVVAVHEGGKLTFRVAPEVSSQFNQGENVLLLRPANCSTAHLRSVAGLVPVTDSRAGSLGLTSEVLSHLERSSENLRQIVRAMQLFHEKHRHFPPAIAYGPDGKPWHSWRVLILPYMGQQTLYGRYRLDEPWDGPNNRKLLDSVPDVYRDPVYGTSQDPYTHYAVIVGPVVAFADEPRQPLSFLSQPPGLSGAVRGFGTFSDGTSNTVLIGPIGPERQVPWTKPEDVVWRDDFPPLGASDGFAAPYRTQEKGGGLFGLMDGSVLSISDKIDVQDFRHLLKIADGRVPRMIPTFGSTATVVLEIPRGRVGASARLIAEPVRR